MSDVLETIAEIIFESCDIPRPTFTPESYVVVLRNSSTRSGQLIVAEGA